ncbi:MAG: cytoskeleton protein RodZ [Actinomycetota bacterium]|nr:cytoskeleton protein RodZ [Actinomycetota bacterium]
MAEPTLPAGVTLGAALRAAREKAGLSVDDISADTRIRGTLIRDLESDRFESSGAPVYARGHVRAITHAIGVDAAPYLDLFATQVGGIDEPFPIPAPPPMIPANRGPLAPDEPLHVPTAARPERRGPNWLAGGSVALAVLVVLFVVGQLSKPPASSTAELINPTTVVTSPSARPKPPAKAAIAPRPTGAVLRVHLLGGDSWVSVHAGARTLFEGVLRNGASQEFRDRLQLRLVVGNAGAVDVVCSGHSLAPVGGRGQVRRFACSVAGIVPA